MEHEVTESYSLPPNRIVHHCPSSRDLLPARASARALGTDFEQVISFGKWDVNEHGYLPDLSGKHSTLLHDLV